MLLPVELEGRIRDDGTVFDNRTVTFSLGEGSEHNICEGVEVALQQFSKGEKSNVYIKPKYGFKVLAFSYLLYSGILLNSN